jgi:putative CocE/NonD family hydrolase
MGPWFHGGWSRSDGDTLGSVSFGSKTSHYYRDNIELPFFNRHLKDKADPRLPEAYVFETGANRWKKHDRWPPIQTTHKNLYLRAGGKLSFEPPPGEGSEFDEYISDPARPVPYINGISIRMTREHMVDDQRFAATRPDVLVYRTEPLTEEVTIAGPITPSLLISSTGSDSDFIVKLIDVFPDDFMAGRDGNAGRDGADQGARLGGYQMLVRGDVMRARFRKSFEKPEPLVAGQVTPVEFKLQDAYHTFQRGHRIMVQIQSTWFPLVDRNPQKFVDISKATEADFQKATQRVYRSSRHGSHLKIYVER